jgi:3-deoxy-D-arabino-heptulosonate 7-phosphate (DAHP) synthase
VNNSADLQPTPETALSDASTMLNFEQTVSLIKECKGLFDYLKG